MRHFIGGWAAGIAFGMCFIPVGSGKPLQTIVLAMFFGLAAWGLLP